MHLPGGYTKVTLERWEGRSARDFTLDIPTETIPRHLRSIGSRFIVVYEPLRDTAKLTSDEIRSANTVLIEEIEGNEQD